jgi:CubicO group peptidase (beta-lactamase class C family)
MEALMKRCLLVLAFTALAAAPPRAADVEPQVDKIFARWTSTTPGCAVGVAVDGEPALLKAYGMADLERDVKNGPDTIFEAGSVAKQFTAAAVLLLAGDGRLSLDDDVRMYVPELPAFDTPVTIRQMITHTSGLRDWGSVVAIAGWPRTTRVHTHAHVLEVAGRQRALNFEPGTRWSYSNTGYNLAAILVARVSGMSFADFTRTRLFEPLNMTRTSWRDDHTRIVRNRAMAYDARPDGFHLEMPFENVHGNGGLLTTVGDLLKWNENFERPKVGDAAFVAALQRPGTFSDGRPHGYGLGLFVGAHRGVRQIDHSGSTAGYVAHLARYPDQHLSVAVLCNATSGGASQAARAVADLYLGDRARTPRPPAAAPGVSAADLECVSGVYRSVRTGVPLTIERSEAQLRSNGQALIPLSGTRFVTAARETWAVQSSGGLHVVDEFGTLETYERVPRAAPAIARLRELAGTYTSDEAEAALTVAVEDAGLVVRRRPDAVMKLTPVYADAFSAPGLGTVIFRRRGGRVTELSISQPRVWDLRFTRADSLRP